jgi:tripeptidyl-peptidase-1
MTSKPSVFAVSALSLPVVMTEQDVVTEMKNSPSLDATALSSHLFPATSPYVTSVGATAFITGNSGPESAVSLFKSGGGFSYIFSTTSEQAADVEAYFNSGVQLPEACAYNATGRATPDVSALGDEAFQVYQGGSITSVGGTSASAPTFSSIISYLNEQRLNAGKAPLGFLNPWVYQSAQTKGAFFDVTQGDNKTPRCCRSGALGGFECAKGWDPVTGVGTPNYAVLKTLV